MLEVYDGVYGYESSANIPAVIIGCGMIGWVTESL